MKLTLYAENISIIKWRVDAAYAVHKDFRGHTVYMVSMVGGAIISLSLKKNIDGNISNKDRIIGLDELLQNIL